MWLALRYDWVKQSEKIFRGELVYWAFEFKDYAPLHIVDKEFYNNNDVWFSKEMIGCDAVNNLVIKCVKNPKERTSWQGTRFVNWESGCIQTDPLINYGVWEVRAKVPKGWPAIWLLREAHVNSDGIETITPEVDIMEVILGKFQHTIHYKQTKERYSTDGNNNRIPYDNEFHVFTVDLRKDGYDFYIDRKLTARFRNGKDSVSDARGYLVITNAVNKH